MPKCAAVPGDAFGSKPSVLDKLTRAAPLGGEGKAQQDGETVLGQIGNTVLPLNGEAVKHEDGEVVPPQSGLTALAQESGEKGGT
jgi:hypothetical protein